MIARGLWLLAVVATVSAPVDPFLDSTMFRHMLLQIPLLAGLGFLAAHVWSAPRPQTAPQALTAILFAMGTLAFWMLPRSLDTAATVDWADQIMHANMLAAGWALAIALPRLPFHVKITFGIYGLAMALAAGTVYAAATVPVCATYTVQQQNVAGVVLLWIGTMLFIALLIRGAWLLKASG